MSLKTILKEFEYQYIVTELLLMKNLKYDTNLTYNSLLYLNLIAYTPNCTVSHISELLQVAKSSVTLKVKELENLNLIEKKQNENDNRIYYLSLSQKGKELYENYDKSFLKTVEEIENNFSKEDIEKFSMIFNTFIHNYRNSIENNKK